MERHLDQDLSRVRQSLLRMGGLVEGMIGGAMQALIERDETHAQAVISTDREVDLLEKQIDEECHTLLATRQPTASDMRFLVAVMMMETDLERAGDSAVNIAQAVEVLNQEPQLALHRPAAHDPDRPRHGARRARQLCQLGRRQRSRSASATTRSMARYKQLFRESLTFMMEDPKTVTRALHLLLVAQPRAHRRPCHQPRRGRHLLRRGPRHTASRRPDGLWTAGVVLGAPSFSPRAALAPGPAADAGAMTARGQQFLAAFDPAQRADQPGFQHRGASGLATWRQRPGLPLKQMTPASREAAPRLLRSALRRAAPRRSTLSSPSRTSCAPSRAGPPRPRPLLRDGLRRAGERGAWGWRYEDINSRR
jgi:phosphate transport system protein